MKRKILFAFWALLPVAGIAFHYGPGQKGVAADKVASAMKQAEAAFQAGNYQDAEDAYNEALTSADSASPALRASLQVLKAESRMHDGEVPEAIGDLELALETAVAEGAPEGSLDGLRAQKSAGHYYAAWLTRLENTSEETWKTQCDLARQGFRFLSEKSGSKDATDKHQKNLESAIRLAQMDISDLKALPLPSQ